MDMALDVAVDSGNNLFVVGYMINDSSNYEDWCIMRFNCSSSDDYNQKIFGNPSGDRAQAVGVDSNNNIYVVGHKYIDDNNRQDWLIKKFASANIEDSIWDKCFGGPGDESAYSVAIDRSNNVYVVGSKYRNGLWIKKFSANGVEDLSWDQVKGSSDDEPRAAVLFK